MFNTGFMLLESPKVKNITDVVAVKSQSQALARRVSLYVPYVTHH